MADFTDPACLLVLASVRPDEVGLPIARCAKALWMDQDMTAAVQSHNAVPGALLYGCCKSAGSTVERLRCVLACRKPAYLSLKFGGLVPLQIAAEQRKYDFVRELSQQAGIDMQVRWPGSGSSLLTYIVKQASSDGDERASECALFLASLR